VLRRCEESEKDRRGEGHARTPEPTHSRMHQLTQARKAEEKRQKEEEIAAAAAKQKEREAAAIEVERQKCLEANRVLLRTLQAAHSINAAVRYPWATPLRRSHPVTQWLYCKMRLLHQALRQALRQRSSKRLSGI
jgi:hypothetical protein